MALDGNGRWAYLDPKLGAMHAVAEAARKVACTGATPVAATNCLNFGNPEKPEIMAQLSAAIDGIAEACTALGTPITGGNVSLYNETRGEGIYPTPVLGIVGILDDVTKAVPADFQQAGDAILLLWPVPRAKSRIRTRGSFQASADAASTRLLPLARIAWRSVDSGGSDAIAATAKLSCIRLFGICEGCSGRRLGQAARARSRRGSRPAHAAGSAGRAQAASLCARHFRWRHRSGAGAGGISAMASARRSSRISR